LAPKGLFLVSILNTTGPLLWLFTSICGACSLLCTKQPNGIRPQLQADHQKINRSALASLKGDGLAAGSPVSHELPARAEQSKTSGGGRLPINGDGFSPVRPRGWRPP